MDSQKQASNNQMSLIVAGSKNITAQINLLGNQIPDRPAYWWLID
ncbi:hypothetical protein RV13_GL004058 [Enterococcus raffinosus]|nr:hypothetical protein RV13_GL004058 [Enterococcus raffinosus]